MSSPAPPRGSQARRPGSHRRSQPGRNLRAMALALPRTLSPSKASAFTDCPLAFRYSIIDHLPEPPSPHAVKGTLVHAALD
ncbi:MAG: PD-(D/E)XK nuclease family protein, partial [Acidimicrobiales bacterium]